MTSPKFLSRFNAIDNGIRKINSSFKKSFKFRKQTKTQIASINASNETISTDEAVPWGVKSVWQGEDISQRGNFASDTYAFVIDSGVSDTTGDLNFATNSSWHRSWISGESPFEDFNGHGTHVAGTIGALVNGKGIVGVAPGAQIVSLKVNNRDGFGDGSTTAQAIEHAVSIINNNNLDKSKVVINLSINGGYDPRLENTIRSAADQGIKFSISAGNNGKDVDGYSPASAGDHPNVFTVSAVDSNYKMPFWSNWDNTDSDDDVDYAAPGVGILSYHKNNQLSLLSGTSMASAHVSGLLITGGVQSGNYVTPNVTGTSDPFAITATQTFNPSPVFSEPQQPYVPPVPTYAISSSALIDEGQTLKVEVTTTNVKAGTYIHWQISGNGLDLSDFNSLPNLWGASQVGSDGKAITNFSLKNDSITEGNEIIKFEQFDDNHPSTRKKVGETTITIQDTSKTPVVITPQSLWGTVGNDIITGGDGPDRITGAPSVGSAPSEMGRGQMDILTGGTGADVFILADSRGVFYNDGVKGNLGTSDYALIKDFKKGEDKIQLNKNSAYTFETINGDGYIYLNANRTTTIEKWGPNQEELIAVIEGMTSWSNSDLISIRF
jgi:subtilisin family serine protease